jgi:hypothetical protein
MQICGRHFCTLVFVCFQLILAIANQSPASELKVKVDDQRNRLILDFSGPINEGDGVSLASVISQRPNGVIFLSGNGGTVDDAIEIGKAVRAARYETVVSKGSQCASACGLIWLAGRPRYLEDGAHVGFHAGYTLTGDEASTAGSVNAVIGAYLNGLGLTTEAIRFLTARPPDEIYWLSTEDALSFSIWASFVTRYE